MKTIHGSMPKHKTLQYLWIWGPPLVTDTYIRAIWIPMPGYKIFAFHFYYPKSNKAVWQHLRMRNSWLERTQAVKNEKHLMENFSDLMFKVPDTTVPPYSRFPLPVVNHNSEIKHGKLCKHTTHRFSIACCSEWHDEIAHSPTSSHWGHESLLCPAYPHCMCHSLIRQAVQYQLSWCCTAYVQLTLILLNNIPKAQG